jgi:hypothetical protein
MLLVPLALLMSGCENDEERLVEMAREQAARQAEQSRQMAQLQQELSEGSRRLVEADALARQGLVGLQRDLRTDQAEVGRQRDALEEERRQITAQRHWESLLGPAITGTATLLACLLPLVLCLAVLRSLRSPDESEQALSELLIHEMTTDRPLLLPPPSLVALERCDSSIDEAERDTG